jgi:hypothetical protein
MPGAGMGGYTGGGLMDPSGNPWDDGDDRERPLYNTVSSQKLNWKDRFWIFLSAILGILFWVFFIFFIIKPNK